MRSRFIITHHALSRFRERSLSRALGTNASDDQRLLMKELQRSVPFLAQRGPGELYLLPCGSVAAVVRDRAVMIVKTILTQEQAIAQIRLRGAA